jgi:hypothetical protein
MEYNATREHLTMREYGRHVQKMVDYLLTIEDPIARQQNAEAIVELMGFLNPQLKTMEDYKQKLWDHLFVISDFALDVNSPYGKPEKEAYMSAPAPLQYPKRKPRYNHLGKNLELVIKKALAEENPEKKSGFAHNIAYYMKLAYSNWHKELVHDDAIRQELNTITNGELEFSNTPFVRHRAANFQEENFGFVKRANNNNRNNRNNNNFRNGNGNRNGNANGNGGGNQNRNGNGNSQNGSSGGNRNNNFKKKKRF